MNSAAKGKMIAASMIGNVIEWYDFAIYGNFAASIGRDFFPREEGAAQLLAVFGAPRKIGATSPTPQICRQMIPFRSRFDSRTFTPEQRAIGIETNFSRCPLVCLRSDIWRGQSGGR
jgi:hypothetical protein